ncbi:MAG: hypothetical protein ACFFBD_29130 [Candidatus Hodarchaeota archaeon]
MTKSKYIIATLLTFLFLFCSLSSAKANITPFRPADGTTSTYRWNFDSFPNIWVLNETHIDLNDPSSWDTFRVDNPTFAEFNITYASFGEFLEENYNGLIHNNSHSLRFRPSNLINVTNRIYVNEDGVLTDGAANGYIDSSRASIGTKIQVGQIMLEVVAKENIVILETTREAWKLYHSTTFANQTFYYDIITGIMLSASLETLSGSIQPSKKPNTLSIFEMEKNGETIASYSQTLISTNAWDNNTSPVPYSEVIFILMALPVLLLLVKRKKK